MWIPACMPSVCKPACRQAARLDAGMTFLFIDAGVDCPGEQCYLSIDAIIYQYISSYLGCGRIFHIKQKVSQTIDDRFALISSDVLYHVRMVSYNDIRTALDQLFGYTFL
jgi:hypothetical protein